MSQFTNVFLLYSLVVRDPIVNVCFYQVTFYKLQKSDIYFPARKV